MRSIRIRVHDEDLRNILLTALDGNVKGSGTGSWDWRVRGDVYPGRSGHDDRAWRQPDCESPEELLIATALDSGSKVQLRQGGYGWRALSIHRGLRTAPSDWLFGCLTRSESVHYHDALKFLQYCLFGEVRYA
jgi:hypothetical protein